MLQDTKLSKIAVPFADYGGETDKKKSILGRMVTDTQV
jgi:hypothetical protein